MGNNIDVASLRLINLKLLPTYKLIIQKKTLSIFVHNAQK